MITLFFNKKTPKITKRRKLIGQNITVVKKKQQQSSKECVDHTAVKEIL